MPQPSTECARPDAHSSSARAWEIVLDDVLDWLDGSTLRWVPSVCRLWRDCSDTERAEQRWKAVIRREFSIPSSNNGELQLWGSNLEPEHCALAVSGRTYFRLWEQLQQSGWWAVEGIEVQDYVHKFYMGQIIGFSRTGMGGQSPTAPSGHTQKQLKPVPPGGCRVLVHFEGWTEKWDEWIVLPQEAKRLKAHKRGTPRPMGRRDTGPGVLGAVAGLRVRQEDGSSAEATVVGMAPVMEAQAQAAATLDWSDLTLQLLLRYGDGRQEWLDLSQAPERERLLDHLRPYTSLCTCERCASQEEQRHLQPTAPRGLNV